MKFDKSIIGNARKMKMINSQEADTLSELVNKSDNRVINIKVYSAIGFMISENLKRGLQK